MLTDYIDKEKEAKKYTNEFLMLPCTAIGQTTSSSIAEKSNVWAEQRLSQTKCELDKKLYKSMIKLNVDMLGLTDELTKMRKSASSSSLDNFHVRHKHNSNGGASGPNSPKVGGKHRPMTIASGSNKSLNRVKLDRRGSAGDSLSPTSSEDQRKSIDFSLGGESSSDDSDHIDRDIVDKGKRKAHSKPSKSKTLPSNGSHGNDLHRTISVTSCLTGHECGANRANFQSFQNATRRYTKQLSDHSKSAIVHK